MPHHDVSMHARPRRARLRSALTGLLLLGLASIVTARAAGPDGPRADSRHVKAAFVVNFLGFADWPAAKAGGSPGKLVIAVLGDPEFASLVNAAASGRAIGGRQIAVRSVDAPEMAAEAHLVFIAGSQSHRLPAVLRALANASVLTVGDTDGFAGEGVAINLYEFDNRVRIEVNSTAAARAGVHLSANLMRLARIVE